MSESQRIIIEEQQAEITRLRRAYDVVANQVVQANDEVAALQSALTEARAGQPLVKRMVYLYRQAPLSIANICDDSLDRSGALLGYLRDVVAATEPKENQ